MRKQTLEGQIFLSNSTSPRDLGQNQVCLKTENENRKSEERGISHVIGYGRTLGFVGGGATYALRKFDQFICSQVANKRIWTQLILIWFENLRFLEISIY